jgi:hypothetical protein
VTSSKTGIRASQSENSILERFMPHNQELSELIQEVDDAIKRLVAHRLEASRYPNYDQIETDTFAELIDKLLIVHIRYWYLEDMMAMEKDDLKLAALRRKSESLFKEKRPMLVTAIDKGIVSIIKATDPLIQEEIKLYKGWNS